MQNRNTRFHLRRWVTILIASLVMLSMGLTMTFAEQAKALVDLNTASQKDLEALKGVGAATAKKIIDNRPYKSADELSRAGIPAKKIEALKPFVTVGPAAQKPAAAPSEKAAAKATKGPADLIDLNTADQKTLEALPGVGSKTAKEIIKGRPFKTVDDLGGVKGISKKKLDALRGMVTVGKPKSTPSATPSSAPEAQAPAKTSPAARAASSGVEKKTAPSKLAPGEKVNLNTASKEQLEALPGIGPVKAQAIIDGRPYKAPEDVMKVKGIKEGTFSKIRDLIIVK